MAPRGRGPHSSAEAASRCWHGPCLPRSEEHPVISIPAAPALALASIGAGDGPDMSRYLVVSGLLVLAAVGLAWGFRKVVAGAWRARAAKRSLHVVDVLPLGGKRQLTVVRCYDRTFALGLGEREVSLIAELDPVVAPAEAPEPGLAADQRDFERLLATARARVGAAALGRKRERGDVEPFEEVVA